MSFYHAPALRAMFFSCAGGLASSFFFKSPPVGYDVTTFARMSLHRVLGNQFWFNSVGETLLGLFIMYNFRILEQRMGSARLVSFTFLSGALSLSLQLAFLVMFPGFDGPTPTRVAPGPYSFIFGLFVQYIAFIPKMHTRKVLGLDISEKFILYFCGSQLFFARGKDSMLAATCGFLGGLMCASERLPFRRFELPEPLSNFAKRYVAPLLEPQSPSKLAEERMQREQERLRAMGLTPMANTPQRNGADAAATTQAERLIPGPGGFFAPNQGTQQFFQPPAPVQGPSEEQIASLVDLGFDRALAERALRMHNNNVQQAADSLFSQ
mmetsp:Transcript_13784/g.24618  ORF Transcript_13784/g.24618 Transcript_13784/m.24618 type:complete len:324 (+) Transcript_13784:81-1052(+)